MLTSGMGERRWIWSKTRCGVLEASTPISAPALKDRRSVAMAAQGRAVGRGKDPPAGALVVPISRDGPRHALVAVPSAAPPQEHLHDRMVAGLETITGPHQPH